MFECKFLISLVLYPRTGPVIQTDSVFSAKQKRTDLKTAQLSGACAITHFTIAAWVDGLSRQIVVHFVNKNGLSSELENKNK